MLTFTHETLRAAYNFLNETPPFNKWNLPDGDEVKFKVINSRRLMGWYRREGDKHIIALSRSSISHTLPLIQIMAHEMVHLHEEHSGACSRGMHGKTFQRFAADVCKYHGFDPKGFF